jgi:hypothetical protein
MKYFLDTEFIERGREFPITLISIGIAAEDGRTFYAVSSEFNPDDANDWVKANVLSHLGTEKRCKVAHLARLIERFCDPAEFGTPEFWGYYADYDWVVFAQIFGTMMDLPKGFPMYCRDLKQWLDDLGNPILQECEGEHNALSDAKWNKGIFESLSRVRVAWGVKG